MTMRRKAAATSFPDIPPTAIFTAAQLIELLGLTANTIRRAVRRGDLRVSRRAGKYFVIGAWVHQWIEGGEVQRQRHKLSHSHPSGNGDEQA
jgi:hypothetical protein